MNGVQFNAPPSQFMASVRAAIDDAVKDLPPGRNAFVAVADQSGGNAAIVVKTQSGFKVKAWVGKKWTGPIAGGAEVTIDW